MNGPNTRVDLQKIAGVLMLVCALGYLVHFVPRGWVAHDEGTLGQAADRVLSGGLPHVDYEDPYTGGLSWLYAFAFRVGGIELLNLRWLLFAAAAAAVWVTYCILRRYLRPIGAALATWVGLAWSFPNYFAGLPSWWLLVAGLIAVWAVIRYFETGRLRFVAIAGLSVGVAIAIKQTGAYLWVALVMALLYEGPLQSSAASTWKIGWLARWGIAVCSVAFAVIVMAPRLVGPEGVYLFYPIVACALTLAFSSEESRPNPGTASSITAIVVAVGCSALPMAILLVPYLLHHQVWNFVNGVVLLPRLRLAFSSGPMPSAAFIVTSLPALALVLPLPRSIARWQSRWLEAAGWIIAFTLPVFALRNSTAYQLIWQSSRAFAAFLPIVCCWLLLFRSIRDPKQRRILFLCTSMLAWASLNQFPYAMPVYFCYVTPLAVITVAVVMGGTGQVRSRAILPWVAMLLLFAVLSMHRGYIHTLGLQHLPRQLDSPLNLPRAHLLIDAGEAENYRRLVSSIEQHLNRGQLIAGPDCPEVYFLSGLRSPSGVFFDFFAHEDPENAETWSKGSVIVLNREPGFSPPLTSSLTARLRRDFSNGEEIGKFEVRWR